MAKSWTDQDTNYLKRYARTKTLSALAARFEASDDEMRARLATLGLMTKDGQPRRGAGIADDPEMGDYEKGIQALGGGKYDAAAKLFTRVVEASDRPELAARARQHLAAIARLSGGPRAGGDQEDAFTRAVYERNRGDYAAALALVEGQKRDDDGRFAYLAASLHALADREAEAVEALRRAVERDPTNRVRAFHDQDFAALRRKRDYAHLFGLAQR
jgi:tetratricopeptide (TPR) repeat protein